MRSLLSIPFLSAEALAGIFAVAGLQIVQVRALDHRPAVAGDELLSVPQVSRSRDVIWLASKIPLLKLHHEAKLALKE
jgi:hypothetical protein